MYKVIEVNYDNSKHHTEQISSIAECFDNTALVPKDTKTTIVANILFKTAYNHSQELIEKFGILLDIDCELLGN